MSEIVGFVTRYTRKAYLFLQWLLTLFSPIMEALPLLLLGLFNSLPSRFHLWISGSLKVCVLTPYVSCWYFSLMCIFLILII